MSGSGLAKRRCIVTGGILHIELGWTLLIVEGGLHSDYFCGCEVIVVVWEYCLD